MADMNSPICPFKQMPLKFREEGFRCNAQTVNIKIHKPPISAINAAQNWNENALIVGRTTEEAAFCMKCGTKLLGGATPTPTAAEPLGVWTNYWLK
jgi:hypothetical protein